MKYNSGIPMKPKRNNGENDSEKRVASNQTCNNYSGWLL